MKTDYLEDLHIPSLGEWSSEAAGDWLHPFHGPLPDHLGLLECGGREYMAALWETPDALIVMLEQLENDDPDPRIPMRHLDDVYSMRGWIAQTYHWTITATKIKYGCHTITPGECRGPDWRREIYRTVMGECVKLTTL